MIVGDVMTTNIVAVAPDDTLAHAANLLRQHQFHHLPVARGIPVPGSQGSAYATRRRHLLFEGILTSQDIELAAALANQESSRDAEQQPWQEQHVGKWMHQAPVCVTPTTSAGSAAQLLVERGITCLPVVEYDQG